MMWKSFLFVLFMALLCRHVLHIIMTMGFHKFVYNHAPGVCKLIPGIESGSEDIELVSDGTVLVSSGYLPLPFRKEGAPRGKIYSFEFDHPEKGAREVKIVGDFNPDHFHPHGFSLYEDTKSGTAILLVVNHLVGYDTVEIFRYNAQLMTLDYVKTVRHPLMTSLNDVLAVGVDQFYVTNDGNSLNANYRFVQDVLRWPGGGVLYCDVAGCRRVSEPLLWANGIAMSRDGRYIYVSLMFDGVLHIYERQRGDNSFTSSKPIQVLNLGTGPDNIYVDAEGDLWIGCHSIIHRALGLFGASPQHAPAQVLRVRLQGSKTAPHEQVQLDEMFSQDGGNFSLTSVAVVHKDRLLIGTVIGRMMQCTMDAS